MLLLNTVNNIIYRFLNPTIALLGMVGLLIFWIIKKRLPSIRVLKIFFWLVLISLLFQSLYLSIVHILAWKTSLIGKALLPPIAPQSYSLRYAFLHFWKRNLFTIIGSLIFVFSVNFLNKKFKERFFYQEEIYLMGLGLLWNPWPGLVVFLLLTLISFLIIQIINIFSFKKERISMLYLWIPCSLLSFFITYAILRHIPYLNSLFI